jgi:hypothetical protein
MSFANLFAITPTPESGALFDSPLVIEGIGPCKPLTVRQIAALRNNAYQTEVLAARNAGLMGDQLAAVVIQLQDRYANYLWQQFYWRIDGDAELFAKAMTLSRRGDDNVTLWHETAAQIGGRNRHECERVLQASFYLTPIPPKETAPENPSEPA